MIQLPDKFMEKMEGLLGDEYPAFLKSYEEDRALGLRINPLKAEPLEFVQDSPFLLEPVPWASEGFYYKAGERPGKHPYHEAGVYYIQEPSAMAVVELLDPKPGEKVLDLCAAPGGKTTHIAGKLKGDGFLLSNEIHPARAKILAQNVERMGISNAVVTNEDSQSLSLKFPEFFDRIVVDAPCSGEGMFRKDEAARLEWSPDHVAVCARRQSEILFHAAGMLKPGGTMVYSTCTFSPEENEQVMEDFLLSHPDFSVVDRGERPGLSRGMALWSNTGADELKKTYRIWPHKSEGEGHFLAVLKRGGEAGPERKRSCPSYLKDKSVWKEAEGFLKELLVKPEAFTDRKEYILFGEQLYLLPPEMIDLKGLKVIRPGLHMGTIKKNRFEPSHALALCLKKEDVLQWAEIPSDHEDMVKYLKGQTLCAPFSWPARLDQKGWVLIVTDGFSIGFAKLAAGILKNHYPKGLRWM
ncbi:RsmB/NOP family class I SAM-dependent RNA methyltransferase [Lacrimispora sp. 38-1]|uniref:RsmB/NOP family class I SAM-dependent RNA methyltransferase n=1 Tax=Lacrimispora sp. 38-1 TaxID=3125778 RepID=UPI003CE89934